MAFSQQTAEAQANRHRNPAPQYRVGDKVWLKLKNVRTQRPCKKLDWKNAKYTVKELVGPHAVRLDTPPGIHPVFHVDLIHLAATDPLPSQVKDDTQPPAIMFEGEEWWEVEAITGERRKRHGRGQITQYRVKWRGYAEQTWESSEAVKETAALQEWLTKSPS